MRLATTNTANTNTESGERMNDATTATVTLKKHYESTYSGNSATIIATIGTKEIELHISQPTIGGIWGPNTAYRHHEWLDAVGMVKALTGQEPTIDFGEVDRLIAADIEAKAIQQEEKRVLQQIAVDNAAAKTLKIAEELFATTKLYLVMATANTITIKDLATATHVSLNYQGSWWTCDCRYTKYSGQARRSIKYGEKKRSRKLEKLVAFANEQLGLRVATAIDARHRSETATLIANAIEDKLVPLGFEAPKKHATADEKRKVCRYSNGGDTCETVYLRVVDGTVCIVNRSMSTVVNEVL